MKLLVRWVINGLALFAAEQLLRGIEVEGNGWGAYAVTAVILGLVNALIRPILKLMTCPLIILTLGIFALVINGFTLWLSSEIAQRLGYAYVVDSFGWAFLGGLIVSVVSVVLSALVKEEEKDSIRRRKD